MAKLNSGRPIKVNCPSRARSAGQLSEKNSGLPIPDFLPRNRNRNRHRKNPEKYKARVFCTLQSSLRLIPLITFAEWPSSRHQLCMRSLLSTYKGFRFLLQMFFALLTKIWLYGLHIYQFSAYLSQFGLRQLYFRWVSAVFHHI